MTPETGGRGCAKCQHHVPDLTSATDAQLINLMSGDNAPKCARFRIDQLERPLMPGLDPALALQLTVLAAAVPLVASAEEKDVHPPPPMSRDMDQRISVVMGDVSYEPDERTLVGFSVMKAELLKVELFGIVGPPQQTLVPTCELGPQVEATPLAVIPKEPDTPQQGENEKDRADREAVAILERRRFAVRAFAETVRSWIGRWI